MSRRTLSPRRPVRPRLEVLEDRTAPAVIVVQNTNDAGAGSLRQALTDAIASAENDQIVFAVSLQGGTITLATALPAITGGGDLSIVGPGDVPTGITIDGNGTARPFNVSANNLGAVTLMNLTLTGGNATDPLTSSSDGGALFNGGPNTMLTNARVTGNTASGDGGGIFNAGTLTLNDVLVSGNTAPSLNGDGGGIHNTGTLTVNNSRITSNSATAGGSAGGGIHTEGSGASTTLNGTTVAGNTADFGGGLQATGGGGLVVNSSTISGNRAVPPDGGAGGGVRVAGGATATLRNTTIADNIAAGGDGGGGVSIDTTSGTVIIVNSTLVGNVDASNNGGGAGGISKESGPTLNLFNSIVSRNFADAGFNDVDGSDISGGAGTNFIGGDPRLTPLQDNGGGTFTLAPLAGSPVLGNGNNSNATETGQPGAPALTTDQRGFNRIVGGTVDQGAVERFSSVVTVVLALTQEDAGGTDQPLPRTNGMSSTSTARTVTLTATVLGAPGAPQPTGTVDFFDASGGASDSRAAETGGPAVKLNTTPVQVDGTGKAVLPNAPVPSGMANLFVKFNPSSSAFDPAASPTQPVISRVVETVGVFDPQGIVFQLLNQNTTTTTGPDFGYSFGFPGSLPVVGNWNGNAAGRRFPGAVSVQGNALRWDLSDENPPVLPNLTDAPAGSPVLFGSPGQIPVAGDWNANGTTGIGVYDPNAGTFALRNAPLGAGGPDFTIQFGGPGLLPVVGDWDGNGTENVGLYNPANGQWFLATNSPVTGFPAQLAPFTFGGQAGSRPIAGDWDGDGTDGIGIFFPQASGFGGLLLRQTPTPGAPDVNNGNVILAGLGNWIPLAGNWGTAPTTSNPLLSQLAAGGQGTGAAPLSAAALDSLVGAALGRLAAGGASPEVLSALLSAEYVVGDLAPGWLGAADVAGNRIVIDLDAAGNGWFVDPTPGEDSEFGPGGVEGYDLLTVVLHEMGHLAGHADDSGHVLMDTFLPEGTRRVEALDALFGGGLVPLAGPLG